MVVVTHNDEAEQGAVCCSLEAPPVPDEVGLQSQDKLSNSERNVDAYTRHHGVLVADMLDYEDEADHEAGHPTHPRYKPQQGEDYQTRWSVAERC